MIGFKFAYIHEDYSIANRRIVSSCAESVNFDESSSFKVGDLVVEVEDGIQSYTVLSK